MRVPLALGEKVPGGIAGGGISRNQPVHLRGPSRLERFPVSWIISALVRPISHGSDLEMHPRLARG